MAEEYFGYKLGEILVEGWKPSSNICPEDETKCEYTYLYYTELYKMPQICFLISNLHAKARRVS